MIFDEAHNIESAAESGSSVSLPLFELHNIENGMENLISILNISPKEKLIS